jgi:hypothetical protein
MNLYVINDRLYTNYYENSSPQINWDYIKERQLRDIQIIKDQKEQRAEYARRAREAEYARRAREAEYFLSDREVYAREAENARRAREAENARRAREAENARRAREAENARRAREAEYSRRICSPVTYIPHRLVVARGIMLANYPAPFYGGGFINGYHRITTRRRKRRK